MTFLSSTQAFIEIAGVKYVKMQRTRNQNTSVERGTLHTLERHVGAVTEVA